MLTTACDCAKLFSMETYYRQVELLAAESGVDMKNACREAGVSHVTLWRWQKGSEMTYETAMKLVCAINSLSKTQDTSHAEMDTLDPAS